MAERTGRSLLDRARRQRGQARARQMLETRLAEGREHKQRARERLGEASQARPDGLLLWLHGEDEKRAFDLIHLIARLRVETDDLSYLVTTGSYDPGERLAELLPGHCLHQYLPYETGPGMGRFLEHWRPDLVLWGAPDLPLAVLQALEGAGPPVFWINAAMPDEAQNRLRWFPGQASAALGRVGAILAADGRSATNLRRLGVPAERIDVTGPLQEGAPPLPCPAHERDTLAALLAARPVWLAAGVNAREMPIVLGAHARAARRSHRLLLILVPENLATGEALAESFERDGWVTALRSTQEDPVREIEIYVADLPDELGLWYRLAPVAFLGGTLARDGTLARNGQARNGQARDPFEAAALGAALLHGPRTGSHAHAYERLGDAGAARLVRGESELARELDYLMAPDKAAEMARAAWEVTTAGAEVTDRVCAMILGALDDLEG